MARILRAVLILFCLSFLSGRAWSDGRDALRGEKYIAVEVANVNPDLERDGVMKQQLKTDTELRLRQIGIDVSKNFGPVLRITLTVLKGTGPVSNVYAYCTEVDFETSVFSASNILSVLIPPGTQKAGESDVQVSGATVQALTNSIFAGSLWHRGHVGIAGVQRVTMIREVVKDLVDEFLNDWLAVNPKQ